MTFYIALTSNDHAILAIDDCLTHLDDSGTKVVRRESTPKLYRVNDATVAAGSGAHPFTNAWCGRHLPAVLTSAVDRSQLRRSAPGMRAALLADHGRFCGVANPQHDTSATLIVAGVDASGLPFLLATHSPDFDIVILDQECNVVTSRVKNETCIDIPGFVGRMRSVRSELSERDLVAWACREVVMLIRTASRFDSGVGSAGQIAVVGPSRTTRIWAF